jgi:light-regulated signal transduction histidine kinase (bacteriophytochrome)
MSDYLDGVVDLTNCDREAIHIPGTILPHGAMLAVDPATMRIEQVAGDIIGLLGTDAAALTGKDLSAVFTTEQVERFEPFAPKTYARSFAASHRRSADRCQYSPERGRSGHRSRGCRSG